MTPEALRRRMSHGNIYSADKIDEALGNYFRPGNLTALRELALLWLADSVEDGLQRYREQHGITATWETRERIVVALTGGPEGDTLIRRAARIAARTGAADLLAVHVTRSDGLVGASFVELDRQRLLIESLGGSFHSVVGDDVAHAVIDFARGANATQIVIGASRRHPFAAALTGSGTGTTITRLSGSIDVHLVAHDHVGQTRLLPERRGGAITARRQLIGLASAIGLLTILTFTLTALRSDLSFESDLCIYLLAVVITSLIGGFYPALATAVAASLLLNYYFAAPIHTLTITARDNIVALTIFVLVTVLVSRVVDLAARRLVLAARASAEAETLSTLAGSLLRGEQALPALLERVRETFGMQSVSLLRRDGDPQRPTWEQLASIGANAPADPTAADCAAEIDDRQQLAANGRTLRAEDQRMLAAFAAQVAVAYRQRELTDTARALEPLAESERVRTALLNAVGHDLRTPIASAKAAVSSLRATDVSWTELDRDELLATADGALDRLTDLVTNLLDLSRLQAGVLPVHSSRVALEDVVARAVGPIGAPVQIELPGDLADVDADAGLLERVIANLVENAVRYSPVGRPVQIVATAGEKIELRIIDHGPGIAPAAADRVFAPFQRSDDAPTAGTGVGLGLAIARGFATAMGGSVTVEPTPGGGATLVVTLRPYAEPVERAGLAAPSRFEEP